jgi:hypothetical protein
VKSDGNELRKLKPNWSKCRKLYKGTKFYHEAPLSHSHEINGLNNAQCLTWIMTIRLSILYG